MNKRTTQGLSSFGQQAFRIILIVAANSIGVGIAVVLIGWVLRIPTASMAVPLLLVLAFSLPLPALLAWLRQPAAGESVYARRRAFGCFIWGQLLATPLLLGALHLNLITWAEVAKVYAPMIDFGMALASVAVYLSAKIDWIRERPNPGARQ